MVSLCREFSRPGRRLDFKLTPLPALGICPCYTLPLPYRPFARTLRGLLKNAVTYNMFFHVEHHLFPAVPTCHLPQLAERLDLKAPELTRLRVF